MPHRNAPHPVQTRESLRDRLTRYATCAGLAVLIGTLALAAPTPARAEGQIRIVEQYGIVYLLLNVTREQQLIEKHGKAAGQDIKVEWKKLSGGAAVNDA
ncbi:MAG: ABC transporter substrate-binding protein, partial [Bordetella sp.]|nr:ABC transporter substrate-binding protein [Bordetella sp.]